MNATLNGCNPLIVQTIPGPLLSLFSLLPVFDKTDGPDIPGNVFSGTGENQHTLPVEKTVRIVHTALSPSLSNSVFEQTQQVLTEWTKRTAWAMVLATPNQTGEKTVRTVQSSIVSDGMTIMRYQVMLYGLGLPPAPESGIDV